MSNSQKIVRIAGGSAFFDDSMAGFPDLIKAGVDYVVLDYLAEVTMSYIASDKNGFPEGYTPNFLRDIEPYLADLLAGGTKIVTNWGGINPKAAAAALGRLAALKGHRPRIAVVYGDDITETLRPDAGALRDMFDGRALPPDAAIGSMNAYFGGFPIAAALAKGADIVITGRVVDSALCLGALIHEFGWAPTDYDLLSAGTLVGHLMECSTQVTGGTFTDWRLVNDWDRIGNPIAECRSDGSFIITKPEGTGGLVSIGTVVEQMIYEVSDPQSYFVPDVVCDFSSVIMEEVGEARVLVRNAKGYPPTASYKVCTTYGTGWRGQVHQPIIGVDAAEKARRQAQALFTRTNRLLRERNMKPLNASFLELAGAEASYGARSRQAGSREVIAMMTVDHDEREGVEIFLKEQACAISAMAPGTTMTLANNWGTGAVPLMRLFSFLLPKGQAIPWVSVDDFDEQIEHAAGVIFDPRAVERPKEPASPEMDGDLLEVPLEALAWGRSGDKGNLFNVGVFCRDVEYVAYVAEALSSEAVAGWFEHFIDGVAEDAVERYYLPGTGGFNFVVRNSMAGGGASSHRLDRLAKGMAQILLEYPVKLPCALAERALDQQARMREIALEKAA